MFSCSWWSFVPCQQNGTPGEDIGRSMATTAMNSQILVSGSTRSAWAGNSFGGYDFAAVLLDTSTPAIDVPTPLPSQASAPSFHPPQAPTAFNGTTQPSEQPSPPTPLRLPSADSAFERATPLPTQMTGGGRSNTTTVVATVSGVLGLIGMVAAGWLCRQRALMRRDAPVDHVPHSIGPRTQVVQSHPSQPRGVAQPDKHSSSPAAQKQAVQKKASTPTKTDTMPYVAGVEKGNTAKALPQVVDASDQRCSEIVDGRGQRGNPSSADALASRRSGPMLLDTEGGVHNVSESAESQNVLIGGGRHRVRDISVARAVIAAAHELARMSQIPGVAEVAGFVVVLMNMVTDGSDIIGVADNMIKRCRTVMFLLQRASSLLKQVGGCTSGVVSIVVAKVYWIFL